ncbi:hypothetical protein BC829DRAFT_136904 [Chytridium lagenaria]|nr:hypothetical protein BC829DRAFT_136904 [Chytridium lagenaria]
MASNSGVSDIPTSNNNQPTNHITPALGVFTIIWFLTILITAIITHRQRSHLLRQIASLRSKLWDLPPGAKLADHHLYQQQQLQKQQQQEEEQDPVVLDSSSASTVQANTVEQASTIFIPGGGMKGLESPWMTPKRPFWCLYLSWKLSVGCHRWKRWEWTRRSILLFWKKNGGYHGKGRHKRRE